MFSLLRCFPLDFSIGAEFPLSSPKLSVKELTKQASADHLSTSWHVDKPDDRKVHGWAGWEPGQ